MEKAKKVLTVVLMAVLLSSIGGCIIADRRGYDFRRGDGYGRYDHRDHDWDRR